MERGRGVNAGELPAVDIPDDLAGTRLDSALAGLFPDLSRSQVQRLILDGAVTVGETVATKPSRRVEAGDRVRILALPSGAEATPRPQSLDLDVLYEDDQIAVINKPAGLVVHAGAGEHATTLVNGLLHRFGEGLSRRGGEDRLGIVHRLDMGTSGVMVVARCDEAHRLLAEQFAARTVKKEYAAIVYGCPGDPMGEVDVSIGRDRGDRTKVSPRTDRPREAMTRWECAEDLGGFARLRAWPETGRMHQVRVHLTVIHHPCVGDAKYAGARWKGVTDRRLRRLARDFPRPALHARRLWLDHPGNGERREFEAPLPADLEALLAELRAEDSREG